MVFSHSSPNGWRVPLALTLLAVAAPFSAARAQVVVTLPQLVDRVTDLETALDSTRSSLTGTVDGLRTGLDATEQDVLDTAAGLTGAVSDISLLQVDLGDLRDSVLDTVGNVRVLTTDVTNIGTTTNTQTRVLNEHETRLNGHDAAIRRNTDDITALRTDTDANTRDIAGDRGRIDALETSVGRDMNDFRDELGAQGKRIDVATEGVAMALALKSPTIPENKTFALSGGFGTFESRNAFAVSGGVRAAEALQLDAGIAFGLDEGSVGGRAGATLTW